MTSSVSIGLLQTIGCSHSKRSHHWFAGVMCERQKELAEAHFDPARGDVHILFRSTRFLNPFTPSLQRSIKGYASRVHLTVNPYSSPGSNDVVMRRDCCPGPGPTLCQSYNPTRQRPLRSPNDDRRHIPAHREVRPLHQGNAGFAQ